MKYNIKNRLISTLVLSTVCLAGCGMSNEQPFSDESTGQAAKTAQKGQKLQIVTSFYPMYEFAKQVAGDRADVVALVPAGVEPHDYEPTAREVQNIAQADLFVYNGAGMENWVDKVLPNVKSDHLKVVQASQGIQLRQSAEQDSDNPLDPHVWLDPALAKQEVTAIEKTLEQIDSAHQQTYKQNADAYLAKLNTLDQEYRTLSSTVKHKDFVTQHAAFGYLAQEYGLQQVPIDGLSPDQEPSAAKLKEVVQFAKDHNVKTIFFETLVSPKVAETVAHEIGAKTAVLNPIEGLTDEDRTNKLDYVGLMEQNLQTLKKALNE